jgi:zinc protease
LELALDLEADRMTHLRLDPEDIKSEREVVKEERRLRENAPTGPMHEQLGALAYLAHPYHWPVIGWMSDIERITREDLETYYKMYYAPNNATLIIVGDVDTAATMGAVQRSFGAIPKGPPPPAVHPPEPPQTGERRTEIPRPTALPALAITYHAPAFNHPDAFPLEILSQILSEGQSSRLYQSLVYQQQLVTSINANADLRLDPGLFTITGMIQKGKTPAEVEEAIYRQLDQITAEALTDRDMQKAINQAQSSYVFRQQSLQEQGFTIGFFHSLQSYTIINEYIDRLRQVTKQDVARVARAYLTKQNRTVVTIVPMSPAQAG